MGARFERYILDILPALGLFPKASHYRIYRNGVEIGEVDILATDENGVTYAVEVKAGKVDITGIRQAYINARLIGARPLVIARGYAEEGARELARELGVDVILLPDYLFLSVDDLYTAFTNAFVRSLTIVVTVMANLQENEIEAIESCSDVNCVCQRVNCENLFNKLPREAKNYDLLVQAVKLSRLLPRLCAKAERTPQQ
jgi:predicted RecB family endonuclease